jgi:hypothetical protein
MPGFDIWRPGGVEADVAAVLESGSVTAYKRWCGVEYVEVASCGDGAMGDGDIVFVSDPTTLRAKVATVIVVAV